MIQLDIPKSVDKKINKLTKQVKVEVDLVIEKIKYAESFSQIYCEKLAGTKDRYKIRVGNYRIVLKKISDTYVEITAIADRKEIYKKLFGITLSL